MDINKYLILIDGADKTSEIKYIKEQNSKINIKYHSNDKIYSYSTKRAKALKDSVLINHNNCLIYIGDRYLFKIEKVLDFQSYVKIFYSNGKVSSYPKSSLNFEHNVLQNTSAKNILIYLKSLADKIKDEENDFLAKQYKKMEFISERSVLAQYLKPVKAKSNSFNNTKIFPFGFNLSQELAVTKALNNQISIIEGPPGTGKTQTILNILANLVINNKTVAVVSNNNTAITNVFDKLDAQNLSFFAAVLGNKANQNKFFENQENSYPEFNNNIPIEESNQYKVLEESISQIKEIFNTQNQLAKMSQELEELLTEKRYFMQMYSQLDNQIKSYKNFSTYNLEKILSLWADFEYLYVTKNRVNFLFKIKALFKYKIFSFSIYKHPLDDIIVLLQSYFYAIKERDLNHSILELKTLLQSFNFEYRLDEYKSVSMKIFQSYLTKRYKPEKNREKFDSDILWKNTKQFTEEYPVILSTTHSLRNCTDKNFLYDYLIIDEASQVDIVAGSLALSCAKNVVVVGDLKQLPHIVKNELKDTIDSIHKNHNLPQPYHYKNNLLLSISTLLKDSKKTLLKEHYRCHPKIIDFCNKKFYNNELIILSKNENKEVPLSLYNTAEGNHARGTYNQRQIDVIKHEILPYLNIENIGIISPFRKQVTKLSSEIDNNLGIEIDTVHKYQGREKDVVILTTVVDKENEFVDNPNLLNVAISRAKDKLYVVVSDREKNKNMKDLVNYIQYNNFEMTKSKIYSIFDLLYQNYAPYLNKYLKKIKKVSDYKSENLMNIVIENILDREEYSQLRHVMNYSLNKLIKDLNLLNIEEQKFVQHPSAHIDFLLYNQIDKQVVLAVEVDGIAFHEDNPIQLKRDKMKDNILQKYNIPIIRFPTNGSEEEKKLLNKLKEVAYD